MTVTVRLAAPAVADDGLSDLTVGTWFVTVKMAVLDVPPPGAGFLIVISNVPAVTKEAAGRVTVTSTALTYFVDSAVVPRLA
jgi:ABC-type thiamin/hydroxymethylpyrimidine transport system permease subunit